MVISLKHIVALFRRKKPSFEEALAKSGFRPANTARITVGERRNKKRLLRHRG